MQLPTPTSCNENLHALSNWVIYQGCVDFAGKTITIIEKQKQRTKF